MSTLKFTEPSHWDTLCEHFQQAKGERFAFALTKVLCETNRGPVLEVVDLLLVPDEEVRFDHTGWCLDEAALDRIHNHAVRVGLGLAEFHNHSRGHAAFSRTDEAGLGPMAAYVLELLPNSPYVAGVWATGHLRVEWWRPDPEAEGSVERGTFDTVVVLGDKLQVPNAPVQNGERLSRQATLITAAGQSALSALRIAVVGAGGTGSHMLTQLAYLGAKHLRVLEDDLLEETNLNRVVTASHADVGRPKGDLAALRIKDIDPSCAVTLFPALSLDGDHPELDDVDLIIGCVDHDGPRHRLMQIALERRIPYMDVASGVDDTAKFPQVGGRVVLSVPGGPCLNCLGELDLAEVGRWGKSEAQKDLDKAHGYGTSEPSPSVVFLNALVVSVALAELVAWISGARPPALFIDIDVFGEGGLPGTRVVPRRTQPRDDDCVECSGV